MNKPGKEPLNDKPDSKSSTAQTWTSEQLLQGKVEAVIEHQAETYRLRLTRQGKLILYK